MSLHIAYRLTCTCPIYNRSMIPRDVIDSLSNIGFGSDPEHQFIHVAAFSSFWTLSTDPKEVFDDAVQHLIAKQQEAKREEAERMEHVFEEFRNTPKLNWDLAEFEIDGPGVETRVDRESYLRHIGMHINEAASNYRSMLEHIQLEPVEVLSVAESQLLDRSIRFIRDAERYRVEICALQNPKVMMDIQRDLACLKQTAKRRLTVYGMDVGDFVSIMGKLLSDLEHYFPADFDNL